MSAARLEKAFSKFLSDMQKQYPNQDLRGTMTVTAGTETVYDVEGVRKQYPV